MRSMVRARYSKLNAQISQEAAEWFVEFRTGEVDAASRAQFDAWVRSSPEHLRAYLEIAAIWDESQALQSRGPLPIEDEAPVLANVIELPNSPATTFTPKPEQPRSRFPRRLALAVALTALILTAATIVWYPFSRAPVYTTEIGEQRSVRLVDGSTVELNSRSGIRVRFSKAERRIDLLSGEALFQVTKDHARPFIVRSGTAQVKAIGTQFDVNRKQSATVVTVVEGRVAVTGRSSVFLVAGEQVTLTPQSTPRPVRTNVSAVTAWTQNQLVFESARLIDVAEEFNRYSPRALVVKDKGRSPLRLSGVFSTDPAFLIRYLRERPDITVRETKTEILITRHE